MNIKKRCSRCFNDLSFTDKEIEEKVLNKKGEKFVAPITKTEENSTGMGINSIRQFAVDAPMVYTKDLKMRYVECPICLCENKLHEEEKVIDVNYKLADGKEVKEDGK